jgi:protein-S-isoprenylcysteine O-methyltransferase Ste14
MIDVPMDDSGAAEPINLIIAIWGLWALSWFIAAAWASRAEARPVVGSQLLYRIVTIAGVIALFSQRRWAGADAPGLDRLWDPPAAVNGAMVVLTAMGFGFCWWARLHLGRLWSSSVTRKHDHHVVDTGPYALVRHPIYTGIIIASLATAVVQGTAVALAGVGLITLGCWIKARLEEQFLRAELGPDAYDAYASRTGMLFPFL